MLAFLALSPPRLHNIKYPKRNDTETEYNDIPTASSKTQE
jgi:hypothetical protein